MVVEISLCETMDIKKQYACAQAYSTVYLADSDYGLSSQFLAIWNAFPASYPVSRFGAFDYISHRSLVKYSICEVLRAWTMRSEEVDTVLM